MKYIYENKQTKQRIITNEKKSSKDYKLVKKFEEGKRMNTVMDNKKVIKM